jgi:hypothetical protein
LSLLAVVAGAALFRFRASDGSAAGEKFVATTETERGNGKRVGLLSSTALIIVGGTRE